MSPTLKKLLTTGAAVLFTVAASTSSWVQAQQIFRIVGADGKVTFSDKPPQVQSDAQTKTVTTSNTATQANNSALNSLPFLLRQVTIKYPVVLYTTKQCGACSQARAMLETRGIPFTEKTVATTEDVKALEALSGDNALPFATLGKQQLKGYGEVEWTQFLNAAGYPVSSQLPDSYRQTPATPLVKIPTTAAVPELTRPGAKLKANPAPVPVPAGTNNTSGIRF
jgi:glutaredoxin